MPTETLGTKNVVQEPVAGVKAHQAPTITVTTGVKGPFSGPSEARLPKPIIINNFENDRHISQANSSIGTDNMAMGERGGNMKKSTGMTANNMGSSNLSTTRKEFATINQPPSSVT